MLWIFYWLISTLKNFYLKPLVIYLAKGFFYYMGVT